jgi:hypothetical protein
MHKEKKKAFFPQKNLFPGFDFQSIPGIFSALRLSLFNACTEVIDVEPVLKFRINAESITSGYYLSVHISTEQCSRLNQSLVVVPITDNNTKI